MIVELLPNSDTLCLRDFLCDALKEKDRTIKLLTNRIADIEHDQTIIMDLLQGPEQLKKRLES